MPRPWDDESELDRGGLLLMRHQEDDMQRKRPLTSKGPQPMTGWNMPPGVNEYDIPGNRPEDIREERKRAGFRSESDADQTRRHLVSAINSLTAQELWEFLGALETAHVNADLAQDGAPDANPEQQQATRDAAILAYVLRDPAN